MRKIHNFINGNSAISHQFLHKYYKRHRCSIFYMLVQKFDVFEKQIFWTPAKFSNFSKFCKFLYIFEISVLSAFIWYIIWSALTCHVVALGPARFRVIFGQFWQFLWNFSLKEHFWTWFFIGLLIKFCVELVSFIDNTLCVGGITNKKPLILAVFGKFRHQKIFLMP